MDPADATERADVLAFLHRRRANLTVVRGKTPEFADDAAVELRQLDVLIGHIEQGLHEGDATSWAVVAASDYAEGER